MTIGAALSNAYSGLTASSRMAETVSSNVANALNENYSRRTVALSSETVGGTGAGVRIDGIVRAEDRVATAARRAADADAGSARLLAEANARLENALGTPEDSGSLSARATRLESALETAAATPESASALHSVLSSARSLADTVVGISTENQRIRMDADGEIAREVEVVNETLSRLAQLNREIQMQRAAGNDASALMDQRSQLVDRIASMIPIRTIQRDHDQLAIYSASGAQLLDGEAATLGFAATGTITADMTLAGGALSGLTLNGNSIAMGQGDGLLDGGSLGAAFAIRDIVVPQADARLDAFAIDLAGRFEQASVDPTLTPGAAGLFTDAGLALDPLASAGIAARLAINAAADPVQGGALWRLRDGLYATAEGESGNGAILTAMRDVVGVNRTPPAGAGTTTAQGLAGLAADITSQAGTLALDQSENLAYQSARQSSYRQAELSSLGVDTDEEMQQLLLVEQAYAANARVISVIDGLLKTLMEM